MSDGQLAFIYRDADGNITFRQVAEISESDMHIQAVCLNAGALCTFRKDRILEKILNISSAEERLEFHKANNPLPDPTRSGIRIRNSSSAAEICFTGFKAADKDRLIKIAESHGLLPDHRVSWRMSSGSDRADQREPASATGATKFGSRFARFFDFAL